MKNPYLLFALRISILYVVFGSLWMNVSTYLLHSHASNEQQLIHFYTYNSWAFVGVTGLLLYLLLRRYLHVRELAEKALRESEDKYRTLFETTGSATMIIEENAIISMVNAEFEKLFGYSREELEGKKSLIEFVAQQDVERIKEYHSKRMIDPASVPRSFEAMLIDKQGKVKNIIMVVAMIPRTKKRVVSVWDITERKQLEGALKQQHDHLDELVKERTAELQQEITERKRAQKTLAESEERYRGMVDLSPEAIAVLSDGKIVFVNNAAAKLIGLNSPAEMIGKPLLDYMHPDSRKIANEQAWRALEKGSSESFIEMQCLRSDGEVRDVEAAVVPLTLSGQKAVQVIVRDITERKELAQEMARLDRLNLVGEMAASIAHEVRNPMTTVRGFLQLFKGKKQFAEAREYLDLMINELDMANAIITEYLALAKNKPVNLEMQNLNDIIEALFPLIQADAALSDKYAQIELGDIPELLLDKKEINQLMLNFVRNGLEAMSAGGALTIRTFQDDETVVLSVQDQGKGIDPEVLDKLGTPFFTTKESGTGLGMAVCYSIAARHKATIDVQTGPQGTTFYVRFKYA